MPRNSDDDLYRDLARILEHMLRRLPVPEPGQVVGFTVMTGAAPVDPELYGDSSDDEDEIDYECVEGRDDVFVTAKLPTDLRTAPYVDIQAKLIRIVMDERVIEIEMPAPIDIRHSYYQVRHGVMDVACRKR